MLRELRIIVMMGWCWVEEWMSGLVRTGDRGQDVVDGGIQVSVVV